MPIVVPGGSDPFPECRDGTAEQQEQCVRSAVRIAEVAKQAVVDQQAHNRMVLGIIIVAVVSLLVLAWVYRKPIKAFLENLFIGAAAKSISTKRDFKNYREDISKRIREKSEQ